jgi:hypothetical protein
MNALRSAVSVRADTQDTPPEGLVADTQTGDRGGSVPNVNINSSG